MGRYKTEIITITAIVAIMLIITVTRTPHYGEFKRMPIEKVINMTRKEIGQLPGSMAGDIIYDLSQYIKSREDK